jgi:DNA processing protein
MQENLKYWLAINKIPNLGPVTIKKLWDHYGDIKSVWQASEMSIREIEDLSKPAIKAFIENRNKIDLDSELNIIQEKQINILTIEDEKYPSMLRNIYDPPPVIYFKGSLLRSDEKAVAVVGTRKATRYGLEMAKKIASELASLGITIVSGLAAGIDTAAHWGALGAKGRTIAVYGCGVDRVFPGENRDLASKIENSGAVVSEFPVGTATEKGNFPRRNRIISGLSLGVIVVEGHYDSGAMITAKLALEQGREVFAVPGNIELDQSKGPHWLIKQGAKLVESVEDVLEELKAQIPYKMSNDQFPMSNEGKNYSNLSEEERKVVSVLSLEPKHIDSISIETGLPIPQVSSLLMMLEIKKAIKQLPGKMFVLY